MGKWTAEKRKEYAKQYTQANKERLKAYRDGLDKESLRAYRKRYYEENKEVQIARVKKYRETVRAKELFTLNRGKNVVGRLWNSTKGTAKRQGLEYNLLKEDIIIPDVCPLLGVPIDCSVGRGRLKNGPSVDRIDPAKGYVKGNVQVISVMANMMKQDASVDQLLVFARNIIKIYSPDSQTVKG